MGIERKWPFCTALKIHKLLILQRSGLRQSRSETAELATIVQKLFKNRSDSLVANERGGYRALRMRLNDDGISGLLESKVQWTTT